MNFEKYIIRVQRIRVLNVNPVKARLLKSRVKRIKMLKARPLKVRLVNSRVRGIRLVYVR